MIVDDAGQIIPLTPKEQAFTYPYEAPTGAFLVRDGGVHPLDDLSLLDNRIAVLSVGSNRAPRQLLRKFGADALVPVTPALLSDFDICHVANIAPYGAIPCAAYFSEGTVVQLNIAWLTKAQLAIMHATESLGDAYEFICWHDAQITHQIAVPSQAVYGYASLEGMLTSKARLPMGLSGIQAESRRFQAATQQEAMRRAQQLSGIGAGLALEAWVLMMQQDRMMQDEYRRIIAPMGIKSDVQRWDVMADLLV